MIFKILYRIKKNIINIFLKNKTRKKKFEFIDKRIININGIRLAVNWSDRGGRAYSDRGSYEEMMSPLYNLLIGSDLIIDVGANYGFISTLLGKISKPNKLIIIEPNPSLNEFIDENMRQNEIENFEVLNFICGDRDAENFTFNINNIESQDSRVLMTDPNWVSIELQMLTLGYILNKEKPTSFFIKIDTQGFEFQIFRGMEKELFDNSNWLVKTEFAPHWLESQGTDPCEFLKYLIDRYQVCEFPKRLLYQTASIDCFFHQTLNEINYKDFIHYVKMLNDGGLGWVDLLVRKNK